MIKAGSLFYAIVISLILAIVSSSLILFAYLTRIEFDTAATGEQLQLNADSGLQLLMAEQELIGLNEQKTLDLFGSGNDSVFLGRKSWGAFEVLIARATFRNTQALRIAQVGYCADSARAYSIYMADEDKPLALCGKTIIKGTAYLPKAGVKRAYIEGQNFTGAELINGSIKTSEKSLPEFNKGLIENIQQLLTKKRIAENDSVMEIINELSDDSIGNSFNNPALVLKSSGALRIASGMYVGNIAIISDKQITVGANAFISDIILAAPKIIFEKDFRGNLQAFASDSIIVGKNVSLAYPSVLALVRNEKSPVAAVVVLNENDTLRGAVFAYKDELHPLTQAGVLMKEKSFVSGQVYSNGYMDLKGTVYGSVMCTKFMLNTPSSVYENHLLNAVIDVSKLSGYYVGISLVKESTVKKVAKWLN